MTNTATLFEQIARVDPHQLPLATGIGVYDRFLAAAAEAEPFNPMTLRYNREASLRTFPCLAEVLQSDDLALIWFVNESVLAWQTYEMTRIDAQLRTVQDMRVLLRFLGGEMQMPVLPAAAIQPMIEASSDTPRDLWVLQKCLSTVHYPDGLPLPAARALGAKIDAVLAKACNADSWIKDDLEPLERLAGRDPMQNPLLADYAEVMAAFPAEIDRLCDGLGDWSRITIRAIASHNKERQSNPSAISPIGQRRADADTLSPEQRAALLIDTLDFSERLETEFWRKAAFFRQWALLLDPTTLKETLFQPNFINAQARRKLAFEPGEARWLVEQCLAREGYLLHKFAFTKRMATQLQPDKDLAERVDNCHLVPKCKKALLDVLRPETTEVDPGAEAQLRVDRADLFAHFAAPEGLWIPLQPDNVVTGPWGPGGWERLTGQIAPYWATRVDYRPDHSQRMDLSTYMDNVAKALLTGAEIPDLVQELRDLYPRAVEKLDRIRQNEGSTLSPSALIEDGKAPHTHYFLKRIPVEQNFRRPLIDTIPRDAIIAAEDEALAQMATALARIERFTRPDSHRDWERRNQPGNASKPSAKWLKQAAAGLDHAALINRVQTMEPTNAPYSTWDQYNDRPASSYWLEQQFQRASVWAAQLCPADKIGPALADLALRCYTSVPGVGIKAEKLGNAALNALEALPDGGGTHYLARVLSRVRYPKIRKKIDAALNGAAEAAGITRGALDEIIVPDHDMESGTLTVPLAVGAAQISMQGSKARLLWQDATGTPRKAPPKAMKDADPDGIKAAKALAKEVEKDVATQTHRLEKLYLQDRDWSVVEWQQRYANHGTMAQLVRRLLWQTDGGAVFLPTEAGAEDAQGKQVDLTGTRIRLWHPILSDAGTIEAWRNHLLDRDIVQPFRQVWRETYTLTDAERDTATYSNRFAGHILRQHQMMTLARLNGWACTHRMCVDAPNDEPTRIHLPEHGLYAEFWTEGAGGEDPPVLDSGAYIYLTTDRLRFHRLDPDAPFSRGDECALEDIPPLVFSEIQRHCDLFTSVASIAMDAEWMDRGAEAQHPNQWRDHADAYWQRSFDTDLPPSAEMRHALLARLLPRMAQADAFQLEDRYLFVQGVKNAYRIHLGSSGVLKLPDNRHVCIVRAPGKSVDGLLPFEGDQTLSLILSKALLLVRDDKITDPIIVTQI